MADNEIIDKLKGCIVFDNQLRIDGLQGEGKEKVVLKATKLADGQQLVLHLYQSNPMFLVNELDFFFLPKSGVKEIESERYITLLEKVVKACKRSNPSLFFWHMEAIYARILVGLYEGYIQYDMPLFDTTTAPLQNSDFTQFITTTSSRLQQLSFMDLDNWEYYFNKDRLQKVVKSSIDSPFGHSNAISFDSPVLLLSLIFCEGFFGETSLEEKKEDDIFKQLMEDPSDYVEAEGILNDFMASTNFHNTIPSLTKDIESVKKLISTLRNMLLTDAYDDAEILKKYGDIFLMRYNAGRNTLLRGLPRFLRVLHSQ